MRTFQEAVADVLAFTPQAFAALGAHLKPEWFMEALAAGEGGQEQVETRRRKLPADRVLWLVIGMGLFRDRSIQEVVEHLGISLSQPGPRAGIAPSAVPQARERLGVDPVQHLFELTAEHWAHSQAKSSPWRGLSVYGMDGTCLRVPDTAENEATFGKPQSGRASAGYPQVRLVGLMALRSHTLAGISVGGFHEGEMTLAEPLWKKIPDQSLTIVDRGFLAWGPLYRLHAEGKERHWLIRAKSNLKWRKLKTLGPGDILVEVRPSSKTRREYPELPKVFQVRVISYRMKGYRAQKLITSMLDPVTYPAIEVAKLYHERWELELGYDEIKTHMLEREESLRSRKPEGVLQEVAGIAIAYNLVRVEMSRVAEELNLEPTRLSFRHALMLIRNFCVTAWSVSPGELPRRLGSLDADLRLLVLPERRPQRRYRRHVKIKMSGYARNRGKSARAA
jgi:hypothetical protein